MSRSLRYDTVGVALGAGLPIGAALLAAWSRSGSLSLASLVAAQSNEPLLWLVEAASLVLVLFGWAAEQHRRTVAAQAARIARLESQRRASLERSAVELSGTAVNLLRDVSAMAAASTQLTASLRGTIETMMSLSQGATSIALAADTVAGRALDAASQPGASADELAARLRGAADGAREISRIAQDQMNGIDRALASMNDIHFATETSATSTQEIAGAARALASRARDLRRVLGGPDGAAHASGAKDAQPSASAAVQPESALTPTPIPLPLAAPAGAAPVADAVAVEDADVDVSAIAAA